MQLVTTDVLTRPALPADAPLVYQLYQQTPDYFRIISIPMPSYHEVERELEIALQDQRRVTELILTPCHASQAKGLRDPASIHSVVGYLDYKLHYPANNEAMVNLLLILERLQNQGFGRSTALDLETRLKGKVQRILVSIYGQNLRAERFWQSLGYSFAIDAKPLLEWYAKELL